MKKSLLLAAALVCGISLQAQTVITAPEGLETATWNVEAQSLEADNTTWTPVNYTCEVGIDGKNIYIQGLSQRYPDAWVKGILSGNVLLIEAGQQVGEFRTSSGATYDIYFSGYNPDDTSYSVINAEWEFNPNTNVITGDYFATTADLTSLIALDVLGNITITGPADGIEQIYAPSATGMTYNVAGQRMLPAYGNGIVIRDGKKMVIR